MLRKVLFTLDGVLRDIAGGEISIDEVLASHISSRLLAGKPFPIVLAPEDWAALFASVYFYPCRLWMLLTPRLAEAGPNLIP
jgi:hypothetical protein